MSTDTSNVELAVLRGLLARQDAQLTELKHQLDQEKLQSRKLRLALLAVCNEAAAAKQAPVSAPVLSAPSTVSPALEISCQQLAVFVLPEDPSALLAGVRQYQSVASLRN